MSFFLRDPHKTLMPTAEQALPGRAEPMAISAVHQVLKTPMKGPFPDDCEQVLIGMGCFWGAERRFWQQPGIFTTAVGYSGGFTPNPTYEEVCSGRTGHNEVVLVVYRPEQIAFGKILKLFWESHNPTQGMRQGNDIGTQYRSGIYCFTDAQLREADRARTQFGDALIEAGMGEPISTEICMAGEFYYAEEYHQQYLHKNPAGYCGLRGTGVECAL